MERINELGLDPQSDFPSRFRIYNESEQTKSLKLSDKVEIDIGNGHNLQEPLIVNIKELATRIPEYKAPFRLTIKKNKIVKISERYTS